MFVVRFLLLSLSFSICANEQEAKRIAPENQDQCDEVLRLVAKELETAEQARNFDYEKFIKPLNEDKVQCSSKDCNAKFDIVPEKMPYLSISEL